MGGSSYSRSTYTSSPGRSHSQKSSSTYGRRSKADDSVLPSGEKRLNTDVKHPIVIALDVTGSMGDNTKIVYDKMPMFWGQLEQKKYLTDMAFSFCAVGDAYTDEAPLQITPFEQGLAIDDWWLSFEGPLREEPKGTLQEEPISKTCSCGGRFVLFYGPIPQAGKFHCERCGQSYDKYWRKKKDEQSKVEDVCPCGGVIVNGVCSDADGFYHKPGLP